MDSFTRTLQNAEAKSAFARNLFCRSLGVPDFFFRKTHVAQQRSAGILMPCDAEGFVWRVVQESQEFVFPICHLRLCSFLRVRPERVMPARLDAASFFMALIMRQEVG